MESTVPHLHDGGMPMRYGAHLPLIDFDDAGWQQGALAAYANAARDLGYRYLCANDHVTYQRPWLDGIVALSSIVEHSDAMQLVTSVSLPVVRGPANLAKAAAALDVLSGGRLTLGVGPGSSVRDYAAVGIAFEERWARLDETVRVLRSHLGNGVPPFHGRFYSTDVELSPRPVHDGGVPIWIGSWGSAAGMRRVARLADGWLGSAYNLSPKAVVEARTVLGEALAKAGRSIVGFPCSLATMWTYVTEDAGERDRYLATTATMLGKPVEILADQLLIGSAEHCARVVAAYAEAGIEAMFIWPLADPEHQLERVMRDVAPRVTS